MQNHNEQSLVDTITILNDAILKFSNFNFDISSFAKKIIKEPYKIGRQEFVNKILTSEKVKNKFLNLKDLNNDFLNFKPMFDNERINQLINKIVNKELRMNQLIKKDLRLLASYSKFPSNHIYLYIQLIDVVINKGITSRLFLSFLMVFYQEYDFFLENSIGIYSVYFQKLWKTFFSQENFRFSNNLLMLKQASDEFLSGRLHYFIAIYCIQHIDSELSIENVIANKYPYLSINSQLYKHVIITISEICLQNINQTKYRQVLINNILSSGSIAKEILDEIINKVIVIYANTDTDFEIKQQIKKIIISNTNYGDPRLKTIQWANINKDAKQIFISWLAKDDLEFFFDVIFENKNDIQRRKQFWLNYVNSKELVGSKVILSKEDFFKWKSLPLEQTEGRSIGKFVNSIEDTSCFILEFHNAIIVEFAKENHALYIYDKKAFRVNIYSNIFNGRDLKYRGGTRIALKDFFNYDSNGIRRGVKEDLPDLAVKKVILVYHTEKLPASVKTHHKKGWHWIVAKFLAYIGIYPGEE